MSLRCLVGAAVLVPCLSMTITGPSSRAQELDPRDLVAEARLTLGQAIERALVAQPGAAAEAALEGEVEGGKTSIVFEVIVVGPDGKLHEVVLDAKSGDVRANGVEEDPDELREFILALRHAELSLAQLVAKASDYVKGVPVAAKLEFDEDGPECEVRMANGRHLIEVDLEGRAGHLVDLALVRDRASEEDGEEDEAHEAKGRKGGDEREQVVEEVEEAEEVVEEVVEEEEEVVKEEAIEEMEEGVGKEAASAWPVPTPLAAGVVFDARITHPYFPVSLVRFAVLEGGRERVVRKVLDETRKVGSVDCVVLVEEEYENGKLKEISHNYFAQDAKGNVWYFGEDVDEYESAKIVGHGGAWKVGENAKEPCLFMPAALKPGFRFKAENSPPAAEEFDEVVGFEAKMAVPAGTFRKVLVIREGDRPGVWTEKKYYVPGVGLISENNKLNLVRYGDRVKDD